MASVDFFTNCVGVEPKIYAVYKRTKPQRKMSRTIMPAKKDSYFKEKKIKEAKMKKM